MSKEKSTKVMCATHESDEKLISKLQNSLEEEPYIFDLSNIFKALGDPTRLKIIFVLSKSDLCVCDIAKILDMTQSAISHQLRILRDLKLVKFTKQGKLAIYSLDDEHVLHLFEQGLDHVKHK